MRVKAFLLALLLLPIALSSCDENENEYGKPTQATLKLSNLSVSELYPNPNTRGSISITMNGQYTHFELVGLLAIKSDANNEVKIELKGNDICIFRTSSAMIDCFTSATSLCDISFDVENLYEGAFRLRLFQMFVYLEEDGMTAWRTEPMRERLCKEIVLKEGEEVTVEL